MDATGIAGQTYVEEFQSSSGQLTVGAEPAMIDATMNTSRATRKSGFRPHRFR
jgi:hypothetical protein